MNIDITEIQLTPPLPSTTSFLMTVLLISMCALTNFDGVTGPPFTRQQNIICCDIIKKRWQPTRNANTQSGVIDSITHHCPEERERERAAMRKTYMSRAVASAASFKFACYHTQDVSIKMSDWACGLSSMIYNKGNKLKFAVFMGRTLT